MLKPHGLLVFSALGVDTCRELRALVPDSSAQNLEQQQTQGQWPSLQDMHDWGDAMVETGFDAPVMDTEHIQLAYESTASLQADLAGDGVFRRRRRRACPRSRWSWCSVMPGCRRRRRAPTGWRPSTSFAGAPIPAKEASHPVGRRAACNAVFTISVVIAFLR